MTDRADYTKGQWASGGDGGARGGRKQEAREYAHFVWQQACGGPLGHENIDHPAARDLLAAFGIDVTKLPGGRVPTWLRWFGNGPHGWKHLEGKSQRKSGPGLVCVTMDELGAFAGIVCAYDQALHAGDGAIAGQRLKYWREGNSKCEGFVRLTSAIPAGTLFVAHDLASALALSIALVGRVKGGQHDGAAAAVWWWGGASLRTVTLPKKGLGAAGHRPGGVHTVVLCGALKGERDAGLMAIAANLVAERCRKNGGNTVRVEVRTPSAAIAPELVKAAEGSGGEKPEDGDGGAGSDGVTWADVLRRYGPEAVARGVLEGIELRGEEPPAAEGGGGGAGGEDDGLVELDGGDRRRPLPMADLDLAKMFLLEHYAPQPADNGDWAPRAGLCHYLVYVPDSKEGGTFHRFNASSWEEVSADAIEGGVRAWMTPCARAKPNTKAEGGVEWLPYNPSARKVSDVRRAIQQLVLVQPRRPEGDSDQTRPQRFWLKPTFDDHGKPIWSLKPWERVDTAPEQSGRPPAASVMAFLNAQLSTVELHRRRVVTWAPSPLLFNHTVFQYRLPINELADAVADDDFGPLLQHHAPALMEYLRVSGLPQEEISFLRCWAGYAQQMRLDLKFANMLFLTGPGDGGKGTMGEAIMAAVGANNVVATSLDDMVEQFHMSSWRRKLLAVCDEQEGMPWNQAAKALRVAKVVSGGGALSVRDLHESATTERLHCRMLFLCNEMPDLRDKSGTLPNRLRVIEFQKSHTARPRRELKEGIMAQGLGAVLWGMVGQIELAAVGPAALAQPARSSTVLRIFVGSSSPLDGFIVPAGAVAEGDELVMVTNDVADWVDFGEMHKAYCLHVESDADKVKQRHVMKTVLSPLRKAGWTGEEQGGRFMGLRTTDVYRTRVAGTLSGVAGMAKHARPSRGGEEPPTRTDGVDLPI